jgi:hypothetical protein
VVHSGQGPHLGGGRKLGSWLAQYHLGSCAAHHIETLAHPHPLPGCCQPAVCSSSLSSPRQLDPAYSSDGSRCLYRWLAVLQVTCSEPYEWTDPTINEWEFSAAVKARAGSEPFHVSLSTVDKSLNNYCRLCSAHALRMCRQYRLL